MTSITRDKEQIVNQITSLDFFSVRANLQTFLQSQDQFTDYNFDGSNLTALLDLLAFAQLYLAFYLNAGLSDAFLSTGVQRRAVVAKARQLTYLPISVRSAISNITLNLSSTLGSPPPTIAIPSGTKLIAQAGNVRATFNVLNTVIATPVAGQTNLYTANLEIVEGNLITSSVSIDDSNVDDEILLNNVNIDTTTISVFVAGSVSSVPLVYQLADGSFTLTSASPVYFVEELDNMTYGIYFGDGVLGVALAPGNVVTYSYLVSKGAVANGANSFSLASTIPNAALSTNPLYPGIVVINAATGGAPIEDVPSIKQNAPLTYQTQRRTVTVPDYQTVIQDNFSYVSAVAVWGGEQNIPVALGYVFASILPQAGPTLLSSAQKSEIEQFLYTYFSVLNIRPIIVDPQYIYIRLGITLKFNPNLINSTQALQTSAVNAAITFNQTFLGFNQYFRYSKLVAAIDASNQAIDNSLVTVNVERRVQISNQSPTNYYIPFYNAVEPGSLDSDTFSYTHSAVVYSAAYFQDDENGNISIVYTDLVTSPDPIVIQADVGTINYETGDMNLTAIVVNQETPLYPYETLNIYAQPQQDDIYSVRNGILVIDANSIFVTTEADTGAA